MRQELPKGWKTASLRELAKVEWGNTSITKKSYAQNGFLAFSASGPDGFLPSFEWQGPAVVLSAIGARCGKCFLADGKWTAIKNTIVIQGNPNCVDHRFLFHYLNDERKWNISGTGQPFITMGSANELIVPVAPPAEQSRIVKKLESLLTEVEQCKERMGRVLALLKSFRQSVHAAACSGRLTADWRTQRSTETSQLEELPHGWKIVDVGDVLESLKYGTSQKCSYEERGVPVLRIPNVADGLIEHSDLKYADLPIKERQQLALAPGDLLLIRSNGSVSLVGKTALVRDSELGFAYAGYLIRLRPKRSEILPEYLNLAFASYDVRSQIELGARSTSGVNNINTEEVSSLRIALPPYDEQSEIIRRSRALFATADRIELRYRTAKKYIDDLPQSVLAKAFRGELVPTEDELAKREGRSYESAAQMLDRFRNNGSEVHHARSSGRQKVGRKRLN